MVDFEDKVTVNKNQTIKDAKLSKFSEASTSIKESFLEPKTKDSMGCLDVSLLDKLITGTSKILALFEKKNDSNNYSLDDGTLYVRRTDGNYSITWIDRGKTTSTGGGQVLYVSKDGDISDKTDNNDRTKPMSSGQIRTLILDKLAEVNQKFFKE